MSKETQCICSDIAQLVKQFEGLRAASTQQQSQIDMLLMRRKEKEIVSDLTEAIKQDIEAEYTSPLVIKSLVNSLVAKNEFREESKPTSSEEEIKLPFTWAEAFEEHNRIGFVQVVDDLVSNVVEHDSEGSVEIKIGPSYLKVIAAEQSMRSLNHSPVPSKFAYLMYTRVCGLPFIPDPDLKGAEYMLALKETKKK